MIKSRSMRWVEYAASMGGNTNSCRVLVGKPKGKRPLRNLDIILIMILY
jgi:hypothetical protein